MSAAVWGKYTNITLAGGWGGNGFNCADLERMSRLRLWVWEQSPRHQVFRPSWEDYKIEQIPSIQWHILLSRRPQNGEEVRFLQLLAFVIAAPRTAERNKKICSNDSRTPKSARLRSLLQIDLPQRKWIITQDSKWDSREGQRHGSLQIDFHVQGLILKINK